VRVTGNSLISRVTLRVIVSVWTGKAFGQKEQCRERSETYTFFEDPTVVANIQV